MVARTKKAIVEALVSDYGMTVEEARERAYFMDELDDGFDALFNYSPKFTYRNSYL